MAKKKQQPSFDVEYEKVIQRITDRANLDIHARHPDVTIQLWQVAQIMRTVLIMGKEGENIFKAMMEGK